MMGRWQKELVIPADVCVDPVTEDLAMWSTPILSASSVASV